MKHWPKKALVFLIKGYQVLISPLLGRNCRFHPSCSEYALESIKTHGVVKGIWLSVCRLGRCHPFHPGGYDPVPPAPNSLENHNSATTPNHSCHLQGFCDEKQNS